jgi:hypothetical protein
VALDDGLLGGRRRFPGGEAGLHVDEMFEKVSVRLDGDPARGGQRLPGDRLHPGELT